MRINDSEAVVEAVKQKMSINIPRASVEKILTPRGGLQLYGNTI